MAGLTESELDLLYTDGYLLVEDALDEERDLRPVEDEFSAILGDVAERLYHDGLIPRTYAELPFGRRFIAVAAASEQPIFQEFEISLPSRGLSERTPMNLGAAVFGLLRSPRILDRLESILGGEIFSNPVQHTRIKLPLAGAARRNGHLTEATMWHQDLGAVLPEADRTLTVTVRVAMTDASPENGCLVYQAGSHRQGLTLHCPTDRVHQLAGSIPDEWIDGTLTRPVPARRGSILIHLPMTRHRSLENRSNGIRWSFDLRYHRTGEPTGRPMHPGFVARSTSRPETELRDAAQWRRTWEQTRARLAGREPVVHRWTTEAAPCA